MFQSRRCVSLGQVLKDGGMPVSRLAFGSTSRNICMDLKAKNDVSPYPLHLRAEKGDRVRPCLQRPCPWALHVIQRSCIPQWFQVGFKKLASVAVLIYFWAPRPSLNNKNDICELIELLCASRAGTCSRRPGQSL